MNSKILIDNLRLPLAFLLIIWSVKILEFGLSVSFINLGIFPQKISSLIGIIFSPIIHKDIAHLLNNTYPIIVLGGLLCYFYKKIAIKIFFWLYFVSGFWLWIIGRPVYHIGASGIIYALASFLLISGLIKKNNPLTAASMLIIFLYGSMIWGILPINNGVSWEGHLTGMVAGILIALFFKKEGPENTKYQWEIDEEAENNTDFE
ncbi:MAG: rhomboid family intramembrane serine protease [Flavobacteriales bacterium]|nr:rhomboid family intramembrane serine protease [Flavobacteriales bacterium]|tara:strand:+ start:837 stop:1451 length:615 start_codon:yes stop_codon:yes gene_type:complete